MRGLVLVLLLLAGCTTGKCEPMKGVPCASQMKTTGKMNPPEQAVKFCAENPEFVQCR